MTARAYTHLGEQHMRAAIKRIETRADRVRAMTAWRA
jgi:hypothetical protein